MQELLAFTRQRSTEMADFLAYCCEAKLQFEGDDPNMHSCFNHIHLFQLTAYKEEHNWIDTAYMTAFVKYIFARWRARLKGMTPYQTQGYRLYLYQDFAPTISVVAETPMGIPYGGDLTFVESPARIMALYEDFKLSEELSPAGLRDTHILDAIDRNNGSISQPSAQELGMKVGDLRKAIEWWNIQDEVNAIRKHYRRRPARFRGEYELPLTFKIYEERLPPRY